MGLYNTYGEIQLKINREMNSYKIGEKTDLDDGVYVAFDGVVVILEGKLAATFPILTSKYGATINLAKVLKECQE